MYHEDRPWFVWPSVLLGASAKGSTLMNAFGIDARLVEFVVDRSDLEQGRYTPGDTCRSCRLGPCSSAGRTMSCC